MGEVLRRERLARPPERLADRAIADAARSVALAGARRRLEDDRGRIAELALLMAERIVGESLARDPALLDRLFARALDEIGGLGPGRIRAHPEDVARTALAQAAAARGIAVVLDPAVGRFGCVVEAGGCAFDHRLDAVLGALRAALGGGDRG